MTLLTIAATYCIFIGSSIAVVVAYRQQSTLLGWIALKDSDQQEDREIATFVENKYKRFFFGITKRQRRLFWLGVSLVMFGNGLLAYEATGAIMELLR